MRTILASIAAQRPSSSRRATSAVFVCFDQKYNDASPLLAAVLSQCRLAATDRLEPVTACIFSRGAAVPGRIEMDVDPDWPTALADYQHALEAFERASKALTAALIDRSTSPDDLAVRFAAEASARNTVVLLRMRVVSLWRESELPFAVPVFPFDDRIERA
jgi:hypothetical protein